MAQNEEVIIILDISVASLSKTFSNVNTILENG
jgi:hypothetical protein